METTHRECRGLVAATVTYAGIRWGLLYNLYTDRLLGFNMFPPFVYETREFLCTRTVSPQFKLLNDRNKMVYKQDVQIWNPIGQQVRSS